MGSPIGQAFVLFFLFAGFVLRIERAELGFGERPRAIGIESDVLCLDRLGQEQQNDGRPRKPLKMND